MCRDLGTQFFKSGSKILSRPDAMYWCTLIFTIMTNFWLERIGSKIIRKIAELGINDMIGYSCKIVHYQIVSVAYRTFRKINREKVL